MAAGKMQYVCLGNSGLKISRVIMGTMGLGSNEFQKWALGEEESLELLHYAFESGINTFDTADGYLYGHSEEVIGKALNIPRNRVVILTKCFFGFDNSVDPPQSSSEKHWFLGVKRLGTYIDVLQIHRLDPLNDVVESRKVRYIGASSMAAWEFQALHNIAARNGWHQFISMQNYHNLLCREEEHEMIPYCNDAGIGIIPWSPLAVGGLTRPWASRSTARESSDFILQQLVCSRETEADKAIVDRVEELVKKKGISMAQVAIAWSLQHNGINPVLGLNTKD
ncbi:Aldo/keto reductase [Aspergillus bertholletiae]|uniref:Aldo/keto reductase n=1 Tax=Aspergillus bertholletiae TaxID=1226010 RepID=A0A5N7APP7_9EURO|nr:Aldo/keto reductase [Aspergillus bertholletiae]